MSQASAVHGLKSSQLGGVPAAHAPTLQTSAPLQKTPSEQELSSGTAGWMHPMPGSHESVVERLHRRPRRGGGLEAPRAGGAPTMSITISSVNIEVRVILSSCRCRGSP